MAYIIDPERCTGCAKCVAECPLEAIVEDGRGRFYIDPQTCTDCGSCADVCPEAAVRGG